MMSSSQNSDMPPKKRVRFDESKNNIQEISSKTLTANANNEPKRKEWYENLPKNEDIDNSLLEPLDHIFEIIANNLKDLNINYIIERYKPILTEFYELSAPFRNSAPLYNKKFEIFVKTICDIFKIKKDIIMVEANRYSPNDWGPIYWEFLHLSSILLSYAYENGMVNDLLDFPKLVYNIDTIVPCGKCAYHYSLIKEKYEVQNTIKRIAFGSVMLGVQHFHNIITSNVDKTPEYANRPNREPFFTSDFALKYKCIDLRSETIKKSNVRLKSHIDWQPGVHALLTIMLSYYCSQPFDRTSAKVKNAYREIPYFKDVQNLVDPQYEIRPFDTSDMIFLSMSTKQIKYCIMRAILLQFQDTNIPQLQIETNNRLNYAIFSIYQGFPDIVSKLIMNNMTKPEQLESRNRLLAKIKSLHGMEFNQN